MGVTKSNNFTTKQNKLATMLKSLAHPARIAIIQQVIKSEGCVCGGLVEELGLAQAPVSQHLKELKNIGIIKGCAEGSSVSYCINEKVWLQFQKELETFFVAYKVKATSC